MGRAWPLPQRRPFAVHFHPSPSATAAAPATAATAATTKGRGRPAHASSLHSTRSPSPPLRKHTVLRADSFSVREQTQVLPYQQQLSHQQDGRKQQLIYTHQGQVSFGQEQLFEQRPQPLNRGRLSTVASQRQAVQGSALPVGGAAGAAGGRVISLLRDGYSSSRGRPQTKSSLLAYKGVPRVSGSTQECVRTHGRGSSAKRGLLLQKAASGGVSRGLPPARSSSLTSGETGRLNDRSPTFPFYNCGSTSDRRRAPPPAPGVGGPVSAAGSTAAEWPAGAIRQQTRRADSKKNLRVSFAIDLPSKQQQQQATRAGDDEEAADAEASAAVLSEEERQFLQYGVGRTSAGGWQTKRGPGVAAAASLARAASATEGRSKPIASVWKLSWPPALRRRRSKETTSEAQAAAEDDEKLLLQSSSFTFHAPSFSGAAAGKVAGATAPRGVGGAVSPSRKAHAAPHARGVVVGAVEEAATGDSQFTRAGQASAAQDTAARDRHGEAKARRSLLGLQRFRHRLEVPRENAPVLLQQQLQQGGAVERPSPVQQLLRSSSLLRGGSNSAAGGGCINDSSNGQPFAAAGIPSSLWPESELLPSVCICSAQEGATATKEVVFAAEGGAATATAASSSSRFFWWRAEARASRTVGCSKGFAAAWLLSDKERDNTHLLQQQPYTQQQHSVQHVHQQVPQQQQEQQYLQEQSILQHQQLPQQAQQSQQAQQVTEQVLLKKQERLCWQQTQGAEVYRELRWQPQQSVHQSKVGAREAANDDENSSQVQQNSLLGFSFSVRQEQRTFFAAQQQAAYGSVRLANRLAGRRPERLQEQQVFEQREVPGQLRQGLQHQQLQRQEPHLPLEWEQQSQQLQRQEARSKREERLQVKLTLRRRLPSIRSSSVSGGAAPAEILRRRSTRSLERRLELAAVGKKEGQERPGLYSPFEGVQPDCAQVWNSPLAGRSSSTDASLLRSPCDGVVVAARPAGASYSAAILQSAAQTAASSAGTSGADFKYSGARRSTALVGFSAGTTPSADGLLVAAPASPTDRWDNGRTGSADARTDTRFSHEQGSFRHLRSSSAGPWTPLSPLAAATASPLSSAAANRLPSRLAVAALGRPLLGAAATVDPAVAGALPAPPSAATAGAFAAAGDAGESDELPRTLTAFETGAAYTQAATTAPDQQRETAAALAAPRLIGRAISVEAAAARTPAEQVSPVSGEPTTAEPRPTLEPAAEGAADALGTLRRTTAGTPQGATARRVSGHAQGEIPSTVVELRAEPLGQKQPQNHLKSVDRRQQQYVRDEELYEQELQGQRRTERPERLQEQLRRQKLQQQDRKGVKQQNPEQRQEKACSEQGFVTGGEEVVDADRFPRSGTEEGRTTFVTEDLRRTSTAAAAPTSAGEGVTAPGAAVAKQASSTAAAGRSTKLPRQEQRGARALPETEQQKITAIEEQLAARRPEEDVEHSTASGKTYVFGQKKDYHSSGSNRFGSRKGSQHRNSSSRSTVGIKTPLPDNSRSSALDREASETRPVSPSLHSPPQRHKRRTDSLRFRPLCRLVSGCCRTPLPQRGAEDYQEQRQFQRRGSQNSNSSNTSSNSSSRLSTSSSRYSNGVRRSTNSTAGDERGGKGMRLSSFSSLIFVPRHAASSATAKAEDLAAAATAVERPAAVPAAVGTFSKGAAEGGEGTKTTPAAVRSGGTLGGVHAAATAEAKGGVVAPPKRSSKLHAVLSSVAAAVKRGSSSLGLTAGTRKQNRQDPVSVSNEQGTAAASIPSSSMAAAENPQEPEAPAVSPLRRAEAADASSAALRDPAANRNTRTANARATVDPTGADPLAAGTDGDGVDAASSAATGASKKHTTERRSAGGVGRDRGGEGREEALFGDKAAAESQGAAREDTATQEPEDDSRVLKCYSLPRDEEAQGCEGLYPVELSTVLSLDSQNSSALSCHSFSSNSFSENNIKATADAGPAARSAAPHHHPRAERRRDHEEAERAKDEHEKDEASAGAEEEPKDAEGQDEGEGTAAAGGEEVGSTEMEREGSLPTAGDPDETLEEQETAAVGTNEVATAAVVVENSESMIQPDGREEYFEEEVVGEVKLTGERRTRLREDARLHDMEAAIARRADSAERAAQRASATRTAAARAAVELAAAERMAATRAAQAEGAATRAAIAREALVQAAAVAEDETAEFEREEAGRKGRNAEAGKEQDAGYSGIHGAGRRPSVGSLRRRSTASSAGSAAPVVVEARGDRLVLGKPEVATVEPMRSQTAAAAGVPHARRGETPWTAGAPAYPERSRQSVGETTRDEDVDRGSEKRHYSWENLRYAYPVPASSSKHQGSATADGVAEKELPSRASTAAAAARVAKRASAAAIGAEDAAAAVARVADARMREAYAADRAAEAAAAAADAVREAAEFERERRQTEARFESRSSPNDSEADVSELKRYATEFLLEEEVEEPDSAAVVAAPAAPIGRGRLRDTLQRRSSSVRRPRHQGTLHHDVGAAAVQPQQEPADVSSSSIIPRRRGSRQRNSIAGARLPHRRQSQVLSREEELAAIAGEAPDLLEDDEDGAAVLARKAATESLHRRSSRRFGLTQPVRGSGAAADTAAAAAAQTAAVVATETAAAAVGARIAAAARDVAAAYAADAADAELSAAAEHAGAAAASSVKKQTRQQRHLGSQPAEQDGRKGKGKEGEGERGTSVFQEEEDAAAAAADERATTEAKLPPPHYRPSRSALPKYHRRPSSTQEQQPRWSMSAYGRGGEGFAGNAGGAGGPAERRLSAAEAAPRQSWTSLSQLRKDNREGDRRTTEKYEEIDGARKSRELEDEEKNREEHQREMLYRRSTQEKHLVRRLLRHRTLQSPLLTVPPPMELQASPVLQAVYSRGEGGAAEAVSKAAAEQSKMREGRD